MQPNIVCLQDTHLTKNDECSIRTVWNGDIWLNGISTNSRGVAVMVNNNFEYKAEIIHRDTQGNLLVLDLILSNFTLRIINLYAPNTDNPGFFCKVRNFVETSNQQYNIVCGDFNLVLDKEMDSMNYVCINNPQSRSEVLEMCTSLGMVDSFRFSHPKIKRYTWRRKNPLKQARLDYFLVSNVLTDIMLNSEILPGYRTDHSILQLTLQQSKFERGRGYWKLNTNLLTNKNYLDLVHQIIQDLKLQYALPVYNLENLNSIPDEDIQFTINDNIFLECLFMKIRGESVKFASRLKKNLTLEEDNLKSEIETLEGHSVLGNKDNLELLTFKKQKLIELRKKKTDGQMVRSRTQWIQEGEKPSKYFCSLENKNFLEKTIQKLKTNDNRFINDQKEILNVVKHFYEDLFSNKDSLLTEVNLNNLLTGSKENKLDATESLSLEGELLISELSEALKRTKNNKTPGIDGIPVEFLKIFWNKLKYFILRSLNYSFKIGELPWSLRQCVITCLPKPDKPRDLLNNWRPISLLSSIYKLASASIANRIKKFLPKIISKTQTGFIRNRFIGDSTRLVYDLMFNCEKENIVGLLMLIDFKKAFDSISWSFLNKCLKFFNFGSDIINWINVFNQNVKGTIIQCGYFSEFFDIKRGCRQGDPISPYLFIICAEILSMLIKNNKNIKGIKIGNLVCKLTQFADDTTLFLDGTRGSLLAALNTLEVFGSYSGLVMNSEKTQLIWIGKKKNSKEKIDTGKPLLWHSGSFRLLGLEFNVNLNDMINKNYLKCLENIAVTLLNWKKQKLTPFGKICVVKTFVLSKLNHLFVSLPTPEDKLIDRINKIIFNFIWDDKPDKVSRKQCVQPYFKGGLNMVDLKNFIRASKVTWMKRIIFDDDSDWKHLFETTTGKVKNICTLGPTWIKVLANKTKNQFWKDVLFSWMSVTETIDPNNFDKIMSHPLWYNSSISASTLFFKTWFQKEIIYIGDVVSPQTGRVLDFDQIKETFDLHTNNYIEYFRVKTCINSFMSKKLKNFSPQNIERPLIPSHLRLLNKKGNCCKTIYRTLNSDTKVYSNEKWNRDLNINIDNNSWKLIYRICFNTLNENKLVWLQYRILTRCIGVKKLLKKINIMENDLCRLCNKEEETILHLFAECVVSKQIWNNLQTWIKNVLKINISFTQYSVIMGYQYQDQNFVPINTIMMKTKYYLFCCASMGQPVYFSSLQYELKNLYKENEVLSKINSNYICFENVWKTWKKLLEE